ncbi:MAG: ATP-binding protein [Methylococcaceae bacterium]|jgi:predicted AAA+ superfamily ATPase
MTVLEAILERLEQLSEHVERLVPPAAEPLPWASACAFRWQGIAHHQPLRVIQRPQRLHLADLHCIDLQKETLLRNTRQLLAGLPANNALLWGAKGTGKSSLIKALLTDCADQGLRVIEVSVQHLIELQVIQEILNGRPEKFILYCDDLSFNADDAGYKALKAVLEGSLSGQPDNVLIYATSNRRHLLPEYAGDNAQAHWIDDELHQGEAVEEKISLSERFGVWLSFRAFTQDQYLAVVNHWIRRLGGDPGADEVIRAEALRYALLRGSRSGRVASQFARDWTGQRGLTASA